MKIYTNHPNIHTQYSSRFRPIQWLLNVWNAVQRCVIVVHLMDSDWQQTLSSSSSSNNRKQSMKQNDNTFVRTLSLLMAWAAQPSSSKSLILHQAIVAHFFFDAFRFPRLGNDDPSSNARYSCFVYCWCIVHWLCARAKTKCLCIAIFLHSIELQIEWIDHEQIWLIFFSFNFTCFFFLQKLTILFLQFSTGFSEMTSPEINLSKKISKMSDIELTNSASSELSAGFSTPPSSSLDTCDSGFNDLYSNSFTLLSSASSSKSSLRTTPAQIDQSDSSPESAQLFDDNSLITTATESQIQTPQTDEPDDGPASYDVCGNDQINEAQLDLNSLDYDHITNACGRDTTTSSSSMSCASSTAAATAVIPAASKSKFSSSSGDNDADDYNDDSNMSDISDLSDVFKLNSDIMPEMQRSIDWVRWLLILTMHRQGSF